jgi:hypothetical protein
MNSGVVPQQPPMKLAPSAANALARAANVAASVRYVTLPWLNSGRPAFGLIQSGFPARRTGTSL